MTNMKIDDKTSHNSPSLRFPEFTGEWEEFSLGEIGDSFIGLTYKPTDTVPSGGIIVFRSSNIQDGCIDYKDIVRVNKKVRENLITKNGDLLICARNGSSRLIGKNALLHRTDANQTFGAFMMVFRSDKNHFVHHLLNTKRYTSQVAENLGARINQITSSDLSSFRFFFPKDDKEMTRIASLFDLLDERIAVQNRLIDRLQPLIKGIMVKLQQQGLSKGTWKRVPLSSILKERTELNEGLLPVYSVSVSQGVVNQMEYLGRSFAAKDTSKYHVAHFGDLIYTKSPTGSFPYGIVKQNSNRYKVAVSPLYGVYTPANYFTGVFLQEYFKSEVNTFNYLHSLIQKGAKNTINITNQRFLDNYILIPTDSNDLQQISNLLLRLNAKKDLMQNMLQQYQEQKQYLLRQMFI